MAVDREAPMSSKNRWHRFDWIRIRSGFEKTLGQPVFAPLIQSRRIGVIILAAAGIHLGLTGLGGYGWRCPLQLFLGVPCPGCGLSSAMLLCLSGHWVSALKIHLFGPLLLILTCAVGLHACLPKQLHRRWAHRCRMIETNTAAVPVLAIGMIVYWASRL